MSEMVSEMEMDRIPEETNTNELGEKPINPLVAKYIILAIVAAAFPLGQVFMDGIFVGNGLGATALAAMSVVSPTILFVMAIGNLVGTGGVPIALIELGGGNKQKAKNVFGQSLLMSIVSSVIIGAILVIFHAPVAQMLGGRGEVAELAETYLIVLGIGYPFMVIGYMLYNFTRGDEKPVLASVFFIAGAVLSIIVEGLLILKFHQGIWVSSLCCSICFGLCVFLIFNFFSDKSSFKLNREALKVDLKLCVQIMKLGFAAFGMQLAMSMIAILINNILVGNGASAYDVAAYGVMNVYVYYVIITILYSFGVGFIPIVSYNYGIKAYDRVRKTLKAGVGSAVLLALIFTVCLIVFAGPISAMFTAGDAAFQDVMVDVMRKYVIGLPFGTIPLVISYYYQAVDNAKVATFASLGRSFFFLIICVFLFVKLFGISGMWFAFPAAEIIACVTMIPFIRKEMKRLNG